MAMLCIALMAVFALDLATASASSCADAECAAVCDLGACDDSDESGSRCAQNGCCHAPSVAVPSPIIAIGVAPAVDIVIAWPEIVVASAHLDALERPPRTAGIA